MSSTHLNQFFAKKTLKEAYTEERAQFLGTLMQAAREGHLCIESPGAPALPDWVIEEGQSLFPEKPVVRQGSRYYLQRNWVLETHILEEIRRLDSVVLPKLDAGPMDELLPTQKRAISHVFEKAFSIICGGPGTGKTFTAATLVKRFLELQTKSKVVIGAPTGKAAAHFASILNVPGVEATTLHRLLRIVPNEHQLFKYRKIDADLVLVDEASMLDVAILAKLLESIGNETRLVLIGDPDQLPPVEMGSVFKELACLFGTRLEKSMRVQNSELNTFAAEIGQGQLPLHLPFLPWPFDNQFVQKLYEKIAPTFSAIEPSPENSLKQLSVFRVLGALRQGPFGTDALNQQIIKEMERCIQPGEWWVIPITITINCPDQDLYNGSSGVLIGKSRGGIDFRDSVAYFPEKIPHRMLPPFEVSFCLSIHKSQGSEFESVLALFPEGSENFGKEAIYTAITRAKEKLEIVGEEATLRAMLSKHSAKTTGLLPRFSKKGR